jgi:large subunit ribosomal protein L22
MAKAEKTNKKIQKKSKRKSPSQKIANKVEKKVKRVEIKKKKEKTERGSKEKRIVYARSNYIRSSARKARLVADLVRGKMALDAIQELEFVNKKAALFIKKTIESAIANAENNFEIDPKNLIIKEIVIDEAPTYKRMRAGSRGRYKAILKRNCHISVGLTEI